MYFESLLSLFNSIIIEIPAFIKTISCNTVYYDVGVRTSNPTQRGTYSKTFITSVFSVVLSGAQTPSTEYESEYEYEKSFTTSGPGQNFHTTISKQILIGSLKSMNFAYQTESQYTNPIVFSVCSVGISKTKHVDRNIARLKHEE